MAKTTRTLYVLLSENRERFIEVENFDFQDFDEKMEDNDRYGITIGERYFQKIDVKEVGWDDERPKEEREGKVE